MNSATLSCKVIINDPLGLHMRPVTAFVQRANQFSSEVFIVKEDQRVNGKSPLEMMLLAAEQGSELTLEVCGSDAEAALGTLADMLASPGSQ